MPRKRDTVVHRFHGHRITRNVIQVYWLHVCQTTCQSIRLSAWVPVQGAVGERASVTGTSHARRGLVHGRHVMTYSLEVNQLIVHRKKIWLGRTADGPYVRLPVERYASYAPTMHLCCIHISFLVKLGNSNRITTFKCSVLFRHTKFYMLP